jgi:hypothetical protein
MTNLVGRTLYRLGERLAPSTPRNADDHVAVALARAA